MLVALLALLAKETAAVVPLLVLIDAWVRKQFSRKLLQDTGVLFAIVGIVGVIRFATRFGITTPTLTVRSIRHALFRSFGGLAFPWHSDVLEAWPALPLVAVLVISALVIGFFLRAGQTALTRVALACSAWIFIGILPVFNVFFISYDLQSSRYLYLSSVGWSVLLVADIPTNPILSRWFASTIIVTLAVVSALGVRMHLRPWVDAGFLRDIVEQQAIRNQQMRVCDRITVSNLPDTVRGAYVFRVGAREEFKRILHVDTSVGEAPGPCSFRWDERTLTFSSIDRANP